MCGGSSMGLEVASSSSLPDGLQVLDLAQNGLGPAAVEALAEACPRLQQLQRGGPAGHGGPPGGEPPIAAANRRCDNPAAQVYRDKSKPCEKFVPCLVGRDGCACCGPARASGRVAPSSCPSQ